MSTFFINATNLKQSGGIQVAQSVCQQLSSITKHRFVVVLSSYIDDSRIQRGNNVEILRHNITNSLWTVILGRDRYLDKIISEREIDAVLTIFGPSRWVPRTKHLCGL